MKKACSVIGGTTLVILAAGIIIPSFMKSRETVCLNSCINILRQIEAGKEQWALENDKEPGSLAVANEINAYIKGHNPTCPENGTYSYNAIGTDVSCSKNTEGHILP